MELYRPFGVLSERRGFWSEAVGARGTVLRWTDYTGPPGFVPWDIWSRRAWLKARGELAVGGAVWRDLLSQEGQLEPEWMVLRFGAGAKCARAVDLQPMGYPGGGMWLECCKALSAVDAEALRARI